MRSPAVMIAWFVMVLFSGCTGNKTATNDLKPAGDIIVETGTLEALHYAAVVMPSYDWSYGEPTVAFLVEEGTLVKEGDFIGQIDTSGVLKYIRTREPELAIAAADYQKMLTEQMVAMGKLNADLASAQAELQLAMIDTQRVAYESSAKKILSRNRYEIACLRLDKVKKKILHTHEIQEADRIIQTGKINRIKGQLDKAQRTISNFMLRAPADGMIEYWRNRWSRNKVQVGDRVWWGDPIVGLPDMSRMKARMTVNETDFPRVSVGQPVTVRLDAFPKLKFSGRITEISRVCREKDHNSHIKVFDVEVLLDGTHAALKPGMTVSCEFQEET